MVCFDKRQTLLSILFALTGSAVLFSGMWLSCVNHYIAGLLLVLFAVALYFAIVFAQAGRNWMDIRAVFAGVWLATIGLACLRLAEYQEPWQTKTWVLLILAYAVFQIGATVGIFLGQEKYDWVKQKLAHPKKGKVRFEISGNRLFWICLITTLIGLTCFLINVAIKGFIPCFSNIYNAYMLFYTKFHVFAVAATAVSGLCYYCMVTQPISLFKKIILGLCILYLVFLFPIMVISRGVFVVAAISLTTTVFYLHKRRFIALVLCLVTILGVYLFASNLRNYTTEQMEIYFEPSQIELPHISSKPKPNTPDNPDSSESPEQSGESQEQITAFSLPPKAAFFYSYITVSHDNFNEAVQNVKEYGWGVIQAQPFNVILRSSWIENQVLTLPSYKVNPFLNTNNLIGDFYYDFGSVGVVVCMLFWAIVFGVIQGVYLKGKGVFALLVLGNTMAPVALCFFSSWLSVFQHWLMWGTVLLMCLAACIRKKSKE